MGTLRRVRIKTHRGGSHGGKENFSAYNIRATDADLQGLMSHIRAFVVARRTKEVYWYVNGEKLTASMSKGDQEPT